MTPAEPENHNDPAQDFRGIANQSGDGSWNPYQSTWTDTRPVIGQVQTVSALAILSLISGIVAIPMICLCFISIPFSLFAIVAGHISRGICRRGQGRVTGDGMAVAGLSLGYVSLAITIGMLAFMFAVGASGPGGGRGIPGPGVAPQWSIEADGEEALVTAIESLSSMSSAGNSDEAIELATHLRASLHDIAQQMQAGNSSPAEKEAEFNAIAEKNPAAESTSVIAELPETIGDPELQRALQESTVYCCLRSDACAFLVGISNLSDLNDADRIMLSKMVWLAAGRSADDQLEEGLRFAVALVEDDELQEISLGTYERSDQYDAGLEHRIPSYDYEKRMLFESFFEPEQLNADVEHASEDARDFMSEVPGE